MAARRPIAAHKYRHRPDRMVVEGVGHVRYCQCGKRYVGRTREQVIAKLQAHFDREAANGNAD